MPDVTRQFGLLLALLASAASAAALWSTTISAAIAIGVLLLVALALTSPRGPRIDWPEQEGKPG